MMNSAQLEQWFQNHRNFLESQIQKELDKLSKVDEETIIIREEDPDWAYENERDNNL